MTDDELLREWREGEARQKGLWREILSRGLYLRSMGIDPQKRDSAWRNPPSVTIEAERAFYKGVRGGPRVARTEKPKPSYDEFE